MTTTTQYGPLSMLTISEASAETGIPRDALYAMCREGEIICRGAGVKGKIIRILYESLYAWTHDLPQPEREPVHNVTPLPYRRRREERVSR